MLQLMQKIECIATHHHLNTLYNHSNRKLHEHACMWPTIHARAEANIHIVHSLIFKYKKRYSDTR